MTFAASASEVTTLLRDRNVYN